MVIKILHYTSIIFLTLKYPLKRNYINIVHLLDILMSDEL